MPDPCDFCACEDCDQGQHTPDCPNSDQNVDLYYGFIQGICWAVGNDGQNPTTINEPDELWLPCIHDYIKFDRQAFLTHFANFDSESPVMLMKLIEGPAWVIYCTESDDCPSWDEREALGLKYAAEWADRT